MAILINKTRIRIGEPFSQAKEFFEYEERISDKGTHLIAFNGNGACVFVEHLLRLCYGVEKIDRYSRDDVLSEVIVLGDNNEYMGSILYPLIPDEIANNICKFYSISSLQAEVEKLSDDGFLEKYRCKKEDVIAKIGMLVLVGKDDYGIMAGEEYKDLDMILSNIKFKVEVVSR